MKKKNNKVLWTGIALLLALLSIFAVLSQSRDMSFADLFASLAASDHRWLAAAAACTAGYILFESEALWWLLRGTGNRRKRPETLVYACADIYCAAITPSASGGQPVCAWFMIRDRVPAGYVTAILLIYLIMHDLSTITVGFAGLFLQPSVFLGFTIWSKLLIIMGYIALIALGVFFFGLIALRGRLYGWGCWFIDWFHKKGWMKYPDVWKEKMQRTLNDYSAGVELMHGRGPMLVLIYFLNLCQRLSQMLVTPMMYMAGGGSAENFRTVLVTQCFTTVGSNCVPVPGGMGIADFLLYDGLRELMDKESALRLELLSRSMSFYLCVIISLVVVLIGYLLRKKFYFISRKRRKKN